MPKSFKTTPYERGRDREYRVVKICREKGALEAHRTPQSGGRFDVWAIFPEFTLFIQVKKNKISGKELAGLIEFGQKIHTPATRIHLWHFKGGNLHIEDFSSAPEPGDYVKARLGIADYSTR